MTESVRCDFVNEVCSGSFSGKCHGFAAELHEQIVTEAGCGIGICHFAGPEHFVEMPCAFDGGTCGVQADNISGIADDAPDDIDRHCFIETDKQKFPVIGVIGDPVIVMGIAYISGKKKAVTGVEDMFFPVQDQNALTGDRVFEQGAVTVAAVSACHMKMRSVVVPFITAETGDPEKVGRIAGNDRGRVVKMMTFCFCHNHPCNNTFVLLTFLQSGDNITQTVKYFNYKTEKKKMSQEGFDLLKKNCINSGLCVECGACELVCPTHAIELKKYSWGRNPELVGKCTDEFCDKCHTVCPAHKVPLTEIETKYFGKARQKGTDDDKTGVWRNVYTGYALDQEIHNKAVSGGFITAMLVFALENKMIDGAVLAGFDPEIPYEAKAFVATTREEILACAGSKYQPHPQLLGLREALDKGLTKLAITSTPCHAIAVRKLMMNSEFEEFGRRIKLVLSNICGAHWSRHGTEWLITECLQTKLSDVGKVTYRARPFPGDFKVQLKDGTDAVAPFVNHLLGQLAKFTPEECRYCLEKVASCGDIVVGDTWHHPILDPGKLFSYTKEEIAASEQIQAAINGVSAVIVRSEIGQQFVDAAIEGKAVKLWHDTPEIAQQFLCNIHDVGKPVCNGPVIEARKRRGMPLREYF